VLPYFDGNNDNCNDCGDYLIMDDCGEYAGDNTNGFASGGADRYSCDDCGDYFDDGDGTWVGRHEDRHVCSDCSSGYTYAYGRRGHQYYVSDDDVISVGYEYYDTNYLSDNGIVHCEHDDEYHEVDDCTMLETGEYVHNDDLHEGDYVCLSADDNVWAHKSDCWQCAGTDEWYSTDMGSDYYAQSWTGADGKLYHEDELPEAVEDADRTFTYDSVNTALFHGVELHCHHVTQFIDKLYA
jgi:transposase-like protein